MAVVTDNGANIKKAVVNYFGEKRHLTCLAHTINLIVEKRISEGKYKKLILDVQTRWNSSFYMIERFIDMSSIISSILLSRTGNEVPEMLSARDLQSLKEVCMLLGVIEKLTRELSTEKYVVSSKIIPILVCTQNLIKNQKSTFSVAKNLQTKLLEEFTYRCGKFEYNPILSICSILDPRFKDIYFLEPQAKSKVISSLVSMIEKLHPQLTNYCDTNNMNIEHNNEITINSSIDLWSLHKILEQEHRNKTKSGSHAIDEIRSYLDKGVVWLKDEPIIVWENIKGAFPNLYTLARKYLSISATSVPLERLFSRTGNIMTISRNRLLGSRLSKLVFLQSLDNKYWQLSVNR
eukprot:XP_008178886.1 PREDICTED: zinc finger BED domain-containing protein 4-like [Acyrthosiphon pisum]